MMARVIGETGTCDRPDCVAATVRVPLYCVAVLVLRCIIRLSMHCAIELYRSLHTQRYKSQRCKKPNAINHLKQRTDENAGELT